MKVELSIKDDRELKNYIKDVIKGQVISIARGEIREIIKDVFSEKYGDIKELSQNPERIIREEIRDLIKKDIDTSNYGQSNFIRQVAKVEISEIIKNNLLKGI